MKRGWFFLLLLSLGLNAGLGVGLLWRNRADNTAPAGTSPTEFVAAGRPMPPDSSGWRELAQRRVERVAKRLRLTPEQRQRFDRLHAETVPLVMQRQRDVRQARRRLHAAYLSEGMSPGDIRALVKELTTAQAGLDSVVAEALLEEMGFLSPQQRAQYLSLMPWDKHGDRPFARRGAGHRRRPAED